MAAYLGQKIIDDRETTNTGLTISCKAVRLYGGRAVNKLEAVAEATKIASIFNIHPVKADAMAEVFYSEGWTRERIRDAVKAVLKSNIYNTANSGMEPGKILSYDKKIQLFTQGDVMELNKGTGTAGFKLVRVPDMFRKLPSASEKVNIWYIKEQELENIPKNWEIV